MRWELEEAEAALREDPPAVGLALRYLSKCLEQVRCMYCHGPATLGKKGVSPYFKGVIHDECRDNYNGRLDYERQHGIS